MILCKNYIKQAGIFGMALFPLFSLGMVSISIILLAVVSITNFKGRDKLFDREIWKRILLFSTPFGLYIISLLWTDNLTSGITSVEKTASFLIIPMIFFLLQPLRTLKQIEIFYKLFITSTFLSVLITLTFIFFKLDAILKGKNSYQININLRNAIDEVPLIGEHPIYFSLIIAVSVLLLIYHPFKRLSLNIVIFFIFSVGLVIASSRGILIAILVVGIMLIFQKVDRKIIGIRFIFIFVMGLCALVYLTPIKNRITEISNTQNLYPQGLHYNSFNLRIAIYDCTLQIIKESPMIGYGAGDVQSKLNVCYHKFDTKAFEKINYNTHNQYFDYLASFGVIGFILIFLFFRFLLKVALSTKSKLHFNFLVLFFISFLTENILARNTGLILFIMFNCIFVTSFLLNRDDEGYK